MEYTTCKDSVMELISDTSASEKLSCVRLSAKTKTLILFFGMAHAHRLNVQNSSDLLTNSTLYDI